MKTIKLTTKESFKAAKNTYRNKVYFLTSITELQKDLIFKAKAEGTLKDLSNVLEINCENITKIGKLKESRPSSLFNEIGFLYGPITDDSARIQANRPKHYRLYSKTIEEQNNSKHIINSCQDMSMSARSAYEQLKEEYCLVWYKETTIYED